LLLLNNETFSAPQIDDAWVSFAPYIVVMPIYCRIGNISPERIGEMSFGFVPARILRYAEAGLASSPRSARCPDKAKGMT
jgi:hypothetical protein